jgi:tetratricopeptide (TPR) repeat protein
LTEFISSKGKSDDVTSERHIENLLFISRYMFDRKRDQAAWSFLLQAEQLAEKGENYKLLNNIFSFQIENSFTEYAPDLNKIIAEKEKYQALAIEDDNANIAYHLIRHKLNKSLEENQEIDIKEIIKKVLKTYHLTDIVITRPKLMYNIISITRTAILASKEYLKLEPYIIDKYNQIDNRGSFSKYNHFYKISMQYMIAHVLYRNKKFTEALSYLKILYENLLDYNKSHYLFFYPRYALLFAAVLNYSGKNKEAIDLLEKMLKDKKIKMDRSTQLNTFLNLSIYYFQKEQYGKSIRLFQNVNHSDKWLEKVMGREWVLKKNIIECINQFELGNSDTVDSRIKSILKNYKDLFTRPIYTRVETFLKLVKR